MSATISLRPLDELINQRKKELDERIEYLRKHNEDTIQQIEKTRAVLPELVEEGFVVPYDGMSGDYLIVNLGEAPPHHQTKKRAAFFEPLLKLRAIFGVKPKEVSSVPLHEDKHGRILVTLMAEGYDRVEIQYVDRVRKDAKCKVVWKTSRYRALVCE
jgi:hypothetical protein